MKLAVVGCGAAAEFFHLPAIRQVLGRDDLWLVDVDRERAFALARVFGREEQVAGHHREVLAAVDAAIVAVPNDLHATVASELLAAGVHVLCEKPLATNVADARRMLEAAQDAVLAVGNFRRFFPSTRLVFELLARRPLGRPLSFDAEEGFVHSWESTSGFWLDRERAGGGVLIDLGSHVLDQLSLWLSTELDVLRYADNGYGGVEADCRLELDAAGVPGTLELSRTRQLRNTLRLECEHGTLETPLPRTDGVSIAFSDGGSYVLDVAGAVSDSSLGYPAAFEAQLRDFLAAIEVGTPPEVSGDDALRVVTLVEKSYSLREPLDEPWVFETLSRGDPA